MSGPQALPRAGLKPYFSCRALHAYYGESYVVQGVSFDLAEGEILALLGRNGAGKTSTLRTIARAPAVDQQSAGIIANTAQQFEAMSQQLLLAADPIKQLPALDLGDIGRALQQQEAAVILSPRRAAVIPANQLFPRSNLRATQSGGVTFDQRFRGEQLISAAIRALTVEQMPLVVFVHGGEVASLLQPNNDKADLSGVAAMLRASRYQVKEWNLARTATRPEPTRGQKVVWVVIPLSPAAAAKPDSPVRKMREAVQNLLANGESVLLNLFPSLMVRYGQPDPMADLARTFGIEARTGSMVLEREPAAAGARGATEAAVTLRDYNAETEIGRAVDGEQTRFVFPVPLHRASGEAALASLGGLKASVVVAVDPSPTRWIESEWTGNLDERDPRPEQRLPEPLPIVMTAERANPAWPGTGTGTGNGPQGGSAAQRIMVAGSGTWLFTAYADQVWPLGGDRVALIYPGNHELALASVAWLAGMDDLIAATPLSQEISRLRGVTPEVRATWWWIIVAGVPLTCLLLGAAVWMWRRR